MHSGVLVGITVETVGEIVTVLVGVGVLLGVAVFVIVEVGVLVLVTVIVFVTVGVLDCVGVDGVGVETSPLLSSGKPTTLAGILDG